MEEEELHGGGILLFLEVISIPGGVILLFLEANSIRERKEVRFDVHQENMRTNYILGFSMTTVSRKGEL
jgi:hypothetical protein